MNWTTFIVGNIILLLFVVSSVREAPEVAPATLMKLQRDQERQMDCFQRTDAAKHRLYSTVYPQSGSTVAQTTIEFSLLRLQFSQTLAS